jgi:gliding motility-associated-like protein
MWSFGDGSVSIDEFPSHLFSDTGWHKVSLIATSAEGCMDTLDNEVYIAPNLSIFFPNAFTPNGDYHNDFFGGVGKFEAIKEFELLIFNRWGELIYKTNDPNLPWNGRKYNLSGNPLSPDGVYVYAANIRDFLEKQFEFKGTFILLSNQ